MMMMNEKCSIHPSKQDDASRRAAEDPWYLAQLKPQGLAVAERGLLRQGYRVFMPKLRQIQRRQGRTTQQIRPLFPGYLFVGGVGRAGTARPIGSTTGVARLVGCETTGPGIVPADVMSALAARCDAQDMLLPPETLRAGDRVRLMAGPFADHVVRIEALDADARVWFLIELMGRAARVSVARAAVQLL